MKKTLKTILDVAELLLLPAWIATWVVTMLLIKLLELLSVLRTKYEITSIVNNNC